MMFLYSDFRSNFNFLFGEIEHEPLKNVHLHMQLKYIVAQRLAFPFPLCPRVESNHELRLRSPQLYPFNYEGDFYFLT